MSVEHLDLDLLRLFEALLAERHVTRAAARVGLTQSAASNALRRLRVAFEDDLFQRTPHGMEPTALARELAEPVGTALDALRAAAALKRPFDPAGAVEDFVVGMSDYAEFVLAPPLAAALRRRAEGISALVHHADRAIAMDLLDADKAHLAIGMFPEPPNRMTRTVLLRDPFVVLMRGDHPAASDTLDLEDFLAWPHLLVSAVASREGAVDRVLARLGRSRRLAFVVSHYLAAAPMLRDSDLLGTMAARMGEPLARAFGLTTRPLPPEIALAPQPTSLLFHNRYAQHPAHRWLRGLIAEIARGRQLTDTRCPAGCDSAR